MKLEDLSKEDLIELITKLEPAIANVVLSDYLDDEQQQPQTTEDTEDEEANEPEVETTIVSNEIKQTEDDCIETPSSLEIDEIMSRMDLTKTMKRDLIELHKVNKNLKNWILALVQDIGELLVDRGYVPMRDWLTYHLMDVTINYFGSDTEGVSDFITTKGISIETLDYGRYTVLELVFKDPYNAIITAYDFICIPDNSLVWSKPRMIDYLVII